MLGSARLATAKPLIYHGPWRLCVMGSVVVLNVRAACVGRTTKAEMTTKAQTNKSLVSMEVIK
jgi:hypothetical protein